ncbi:sugar ABC transporter permease [Cohnella algarum]|nr:sugar ABC transporter permease [Cohnella algarum]MBN2984058.1 sugar ABC transporter permease [Cohnella algarum]
MAAKFLADDPAHYRDDDVAGVRGTVILYLASLQGVNHELYEASAIDGAGIRKRLRHITIPQISHIIGIMFILQIIGVFQVLYEPLTMTEGGPNNASMSLMLTSYHYAFRYFEAGRSLAVGVITFVILAALTAVYFRINKRSNED